MMDDDASSLGDYALDRGDCNQQYSAQVVQLSRPQRSRSKPERSSIAPGKASKMEMYLNHLAKYTLTESCASECKQEDQIPTKRRPSKIESICHDVRSWITSERLGAGMEDKIGEENEEVNDRITFEKFKIDVKETAPVKISKRKLNDATVNLDKCAKEAVQEAFSKVLQEITSAAWRRIQDACASGRQCEMAFDFFRRKTAEADEQKRHYLQMQTKYLKEVSMLRDHLNHGRSEKMKDTGINVQMWNPLEDLDAETHALVLACSEEQLKTHLTTESELREVLECRVNAAEDALAHAQNKAHEQAIDIAKLKKVIQQRIKSLQNNALLVSSDSKGGELSEEQIFCGACGAHVAIPTHLVNDLQNKDNLDTAARLPVAVRAQRQVSLSNRKSLPLASLVSGSQNFSSSGNEHDEQANNQNAQAAEEQAEEIHKKLDLPADACASGRSDFDLQQVADIGREDSEKIEDGLQTARAPRRISMVTGDCKVPAIARRSFRSKSTKLHRSTTYHIDSSARRSVSGNPDEKASFMVSGSGALRKCSLAHATPPTYGETAPPTHGETESQPTIAAQDSAANVHNQQRDIVISKRSSSKSSSKNGADLGRICKSPTELATRCALAPMWVNGLEVSGSTTKVQSWESGLEVSGLTTRVQSWESDLEVPGSTTAAPSPDPESSLEVISTPRQERIRQASSYISPASSACSLQSPEENDLPSLPLRPASPAGMHGSKLSSGRWSRFLHRQKK